MSATTEHVPPSPEHHEHHHLSEEIDHPTPLTFIKVALILAVITAVETSTYWWMDKAHGLAMATLFIMMTIKFFMILLWFMHLKWDSKLFSLMFYIGLGLALAVYLVALFTFQFFTH